MDTEDTSMWRGDGAAGDQTEIVPPAPDAPTPLAWHYEVPNYAPTVAPSRHPGVIVFVSVLVTAAVLAVAAAGC
jgi:hypothetical protein